MNYSTNGISTFWIFVIIILLFAWYLTPPILSAVIANKKGKEPGVWVLCGLFLGWISVIIICCLSRNNAVARPTTRTHIRISPEQKYQPYNCVNCGEKITTRRCPYCGCEHKAESLKKATLIASDNNRTNYWYCSCGACNPESNSECFACFKPKVK